MTWWLYQSTELQSLCNHSHAIIVTASHWSNCVIACSYIRSYEIEGLLDDSIFLSPLSIRLTNLFTPNKGSVKPQGLEREGKYCRIWKGEEKGKTKLKSEVRRSESVKGCGQRRREWRRVFKKRSKWRGLMNRKVRWGGNCKEWGQNEGECQRVGSKWGEEGEWVGSGKGRALMGGFKNEES